MVGNLIDPPVMSVVDEIVQIFNWIRVDIFEVIADYLNSEASVPVASVVGKRGSGAKLFIEKYDDKFYLKESACL